MAELTFDIIFIDCSDSIPYDRKSLENRPMGGVESSVIRVAEGLASLNLTVGVIKASDPSKDFIVPEFEPIMGQHAFFMHEKELPRIVTRFLVCLRGPLYLEYFNEYARGQKTKKFVWCHDLATESINQWRDILRAHDATVIGVSRFHKQNIMKYLNYHKVTYAYNPLPDEVYRASETRKVNRDLMVWASSPHKGLNEALGIYKRIHEKLPNLRLLIYNPGYNKGETIINPGVLYYGPTVIKNVWHNIRNSLCIFYPTKFEETFGLVAAEANALGTPIIGYKTGALPEVVNGSNQLLDVDQEDEVVSRVQHWYKDGPPSTNGKEEFRIGNVIGQWFKIFAGGRP